MVLGWVVNANLLFGSGLVIECMVWRGFSVVELVVVSCLVEYGFEIFFGFLVANEFVDIKSFHQILTSLNSKIFIVPDFNNVRWDAYENLKCFLIMTAKVNHYLRISFLHKRHFTFLVINKICTVLGSRLAWSTISSSRHNSRIHYKQGRLRADALSRIH